MAGIAVSVSLLLPADSLAEGELAGDFAASWDLCGATTFAVEREAGIPKSLLTAISIAESGRRDELNRTNVAWPWTVTSGSRQWYLDNKAEAVAQVTSMIHGGERNIDVGCMQINLYFHGDAFATLDAAFDPPTNVRYAASYLRQLRTSTNDWMTAAGNYHSATPEFHQRYKGKIAKIWRSQRLSYSTNSQKYDRAGLQYVSADVPPIDQTRTAELNSAFKRRLTTDVQSADGSAEGLLGSIGGSDWRTAYLLQSGQGNNYALQAQVNRVHQAADRKNQIEQLSKEHENISSDTRATDLDRWRKMYGQAVSGPSMLEMLSGGIQ